MGQRRSERRKEELFKGGSSDHIAPWASLDEERRNEVFEEQKPQTKKNEKMLRKKTG